MELSHQDIRRIVAHGCRSLMSARQVGSHWDFHAHLGPHFSSQYALCLRWLDRNDSRLDRAHLKHLLLSTRLSDGSWHQVRDLSVSQGDLNATIFNYWYLKSQGLALEDPVLKSARQFILKSGGIEASSLFTKTFLALFGEYPWRHLAYVPYALFSEHLPSNYRSFSQWVVPHLIPMAYLRANHVSKRLGSSFCVRELWREAPPRIWSLKAPVVMNRWMVQKIREHQQPKGSWGGYTVSTLLSLMALDHHQEQTGADPAIGASIGRGLHFISDLYMSPNLGAYQGCLMDGHYWDTLLAANALLECDWSARELDETVQYIARTQTPGGGFPYGFDFEYAPDVDDTAEAMLLFSRFPDLKKASRKGGDWLLSLQNKDGGWGAFDQNNVGNGLLRWATKGYQDSVDLFDDSSADSTGHVLDALNSIGLTKKNSRHVRKAVRYLERTQHKNGGWEGRWAINYLFGTTCALVGLVKAGESPKHQAIQKGLRFLKTCQNKDGGFGETTRSYRDASLAGHGPSTPSQTAWVLWALSHCGLARSLTAQRAAHYLVETIQVDGSWKDESVTGTGHPGLLYMNYPSYARCFPLLALGSYLKASARKPKSRSPLKTISSSGRDELTVEQNPKPHG